MSDPLVLFGSRADLRREFYLLAQLPLHERKDLSKPEWHAHQLQEPTKLLFPVTKPQLCSANQGFYSVWEREGQIRLTEYHALTKKSQRVIMLGEVGGKRQMPTMAYDGRDLCVAWLEADESDANTMRIGWQILQAFDLSFKVGGSLMPGAGTLTGVPKDTHVEVVSWEGSQFLLIY